jgi:hypothetical protein
MISAVKLSLRYLLLTGVAVLLSACITTPEMKNRWSFVCPDGFAFNANYSRSMKSVRLAADGLSEKARLRESDDASAGVRYAGNDTEFFPRGVMADLYIGPDAKNGYSADSGKTRAHLNCQGNAY